MATLYIVATPIGNLKDITLRALETLAKVDIIAAEDTRMAKKLLHAHNLATPLISYHQHNAPQRDAELIAELQQGKKIALITDAGTPLISDPGHSIVSLCRKNHIQVIPIPGACAAVAALCVNDFSITRYFFEGFLPAKHSARIQRLQTVCVYPQAIIFYEAKHRILAMLNDLSDVCGSQRRVMIARELTKLHEQIVSGSLGEVIQQLEDDSIPTKGEFVIVLEGATQNKDTDAELEKMRILFNKVSVLMSRKDAVQLACLLSGLPKNMLYEVAGEYY